MSPFSAATRRSLLRWGVWAALLAVAVAVYLNTLFNDFVWDDFYLILEDHTIKSFKYLRYIFTSDFFGHQEDDLAYGYFRPLVSLSYALDYLLWQTNPFGYHLTNILLHGIATLLVAGGLLRMGQERRVAVIAALFFAVHPMHTESVAWISGRTDLIAFVFAMTAFVLHRNRLGGGRGAALKGLAAICFAASLLAKEMAVVLIPWIALVELALDRRPWRRIALSLAPYLGAVLLYGVWRFGVVDVAVPYQRNSVPAALISAPWTVARYLGWLVLPIRQSAYVKNPLISGVGDPRLYLGVAAVAAGVYFAVRLRRRSPRAVLLAAMLGVSFFPILNIVAVSAPVDMGNPMSERFLYFPSFPFVALAALAVNSLRRRWPNRRALIAAMTAAVVVALVGKTVTRNRVWRNNEVFYRTTLGASPSALMWCNLANHYIHTGQWDNAKKALGKAQSYFSDDYHYLSSMALWHVAQRQYAAAIPLQLKAAAKVKRGRAVAYNNLAFLYRVTGDLARAEALLEEIIDNRKGYADVYLNLAEVRRAKGETAAAIPYYQKALARRPDNLRTATSLASALMQTGRLDEAAAVFEEQLEMHPSTPGLLNNLGVIHQKARRMARAEAMFRRALDLDPSYAKARLNLADALIASERNGEARGQLEQLLAGHPDTPEAAEALKRLEQLGRKGAP